MEDQNSVQKSEKGLKGAQDTLWGSQKHEGRESEEMWSGHKEYFTGSQNVPVIKPWNTTEKELYTEMWVSWP